MFRPGENLIMHKAVEDLQKVDWHAARRGQVWELLNLCLNDGCETPCAVRGA